MKCLTYDQSVEWFKSFHASIDNNQALLFPSSGNGHLISVELPKAALALSCFSESLVRWLPNGASRMLWLDSWQKQRLFFEGVRRGCGEFRHIIDAPGHLFDAFSGDIDSFYNDEENAILSGLVLLVLCFDWRGYLVAEGSDEYIRLGDDFVGFYSVNDDKIGLAKELVVSFKLKYRQLS